VETAERVDLQWPEWLNLTLYRGKFYFVPLESGDRVAMVEMVASLMQAEQMEQVEEME
jgi:hypothetical protein